jgi:hypothetical protein
MEMHKIMQYDTGKKKIKIKQTKESRHMDSLFFFEKIVINLK